MSHSVQVKEALDEGADVEVADGAGHTALSEASAGGQMEIAMLLADKVAHTQLCEAAVV